MTIPRRLQATGDLYINPRLTLAAGELEISQARSSGPGGQNVNKVNSKVTLRWSPMKCERLDEGWRRRLLSRHANRITREGDLVLQSDRYRDRLRNLADVRQRLAEMLLECQAPAQKRRPTRPTLGSKKRRLKAKRQQSEKKSGRGPLRLDE